LASRNQIGQHVLHATEVRKPGAHFGKLMLRNGGGVGAMRSILKL